MPAGFIAQPDAIAATGAVDLAGAAIDDGHSDATEVLRADGFLGGYQRLWRTFDGHRLLVELYRFTSLAGASAWRDRVVAADSRTVSAGTPVQQAGPPGAPGSVLLTVPGAAVARVEFVRDRDVVVVGATAAGPAEAVAIAEQVAAAQFARLSG